MHPSFGRSYPVYFGCLRQLYLLSLHFTFDGKCTSRISGEARLTTVRLSYSLRITARLTLLVPLRGFEPLLHGSEPCVLPLDEWGIWGGEPPQLKCQSLLSSSMLGCSVTVLLRVAPRINRVALVEVPSQPYSARTVPSPKAGGMQENRTPIGWVTAIRLTLRPTSPRYTPKGRSYQRDTNPLTILTKDCACPELVAYSPSGHLTPHEG